MQDQLDLTKGGEADLQAPESIWVAVSASTAGGREAGCASVRVAGAGRSRTSRACDLQDLEYVVHGLDEIEMDDCPPCFGFRVERLRSELQLEVLEQSRLPGLGLT